MEEVAVRNREEVYLLLKRGAEKRRTAATLMNISSRLILVTNIFIF